MSPYPARPTPDDGGGVAAKPAPMTVPDDWALDAVPTNIRTAADAWKTLHDGYQTEKPNFSGKVDSVATHWDADNGDDFRASYAGAQANAMVDLAGAAGSVRTALITLADGLDEVQHKLDASLGRLRAAMDASGACTTSGNVYTFHPDDDADVQLINKERAIAAGLQADAKSLVRTCNTTLGQIPETFTQLKSGWEKEADGPPQRWTKHPAGSSNYRTVQTINGTTIVSGNNTDEHVRVEIDPVTGETVLIFSRIGRVDRDTNPHDRVTDFAYTYTEEQRIRIPAGQEVVVNTGGGNDQLEVPPGVNVKLRVLLGSGDDQVNSREADARIEAFAGQGKDRVTTGKGADFISTGSGDDYVDGGASADQIFGGSGDDSLYGLDGNDLVVGEDGRDFIDGGSHNDTVFGNGGNDTVGGGRDDDRMFGGSGNDHLFGGHGTDLGDGGVTMGSNGMPACDTDELTIGSADTARDSEGDRVITLEYDGSLGGFIEVQGSPEFQARVNSDLEFLRSTTSGQEMLRKLAELRDEKDGIFSGPPNYRIIEFDRAAAYDNGYESTDGDGNVTITYKPEFATLNGSNGTEADPYRATPPLVVLYHEMGHSYQFWSGNVASGRTHQHNGTDVNSLERENVGLSYADNNRSGDDPGLAPDTQPDPDQHVYRENGLRDELGLDRRKQY